MAYVASQRFFLSLAAYMLIGVKSCRQLFVLIIGCMKNMGSPNYLRTSFNLLSMIYEVEYCFVV